MPIQTTTRVIAGHELTLVPGRRYLATRPMAMKGDQFFDVAITDITDGFSFDRLVSARVECLTYDQSNELLAAFNNGETSWEGRIWEQPIDLNEKPDSL